MSEKEYIERETVRNTIKAVCEKYNQAFGGHYILLEQGYKRKYTISMENLR